MPRSVFSFFTEPRFRPYRWAVGLAFVFCFHYVFGFVVRNVAQAKFPERAAHWPVRGSYALVGLSAGENQQEDMIYASRVKEASEHLLPYDPYVRENRSLRLLLVDHLNYRFMGAVHLLTGNISLTWLVTRLLCCVFWFLLVYKLTFRLTGSEDVAIFTGVFITCFSYLLTFLFVSALQWSWNPVKLLAKNAWVVLSYGRTESLYRLPRPGLTYAALFLAALLNIRAAEERGLKWAVISGVWGGLLAYTRLDISTTFLGATVFFAVAHGWKHGYDRRLPAAAGIAVLISLPFYLVNMGPSRELLLKTNVTFGRHIYWGSLPYLALFAAALRWERAPARLFMACVAGSVGVIMNSQLITGFELQWEHWAFFANIFVFFFVLSYVPERFKARGRAWLAAGALCAALAFLQNMVYASIHYPFQGLPLDKERAAQWLTANTQRESVVLALDPEAVLMIPAYTHNKTGFAHGAPHISDLPLRENARRMREVLRLYGADEEKFFRECIEKKTPLERRATERRTQPMEGFVRGMFFHGIETPYMLEVWKDAKASPLKEPVRTDYVWVGDFERRYLGGDFPKGSPLELEEAYRGGTVAIYRRL